MVESDSSEVSWGNEFDDDDEWNESEHDIKLELEEKSNSDDNSSAGFSESTSSESEGQEHSGNKAKRKRKCKDEAKTSERKPIKKPSDSDYEYVNLSEFGPTDEIKNLKKPVDIFSRLITDAILTDAIKSTNEQIKEKNVSVNVKNSYLYHKEMKSWIGILLQTAATNSNHLPTDILFNSKYSGGIYKGNMSAERFSFLLRSIQFDTTPITKHTPADKFKPLRKTWNAFTKNCKKLYNTGNYVTLGDQVLPFRGACPFTTTFKDARCKYGIRIIVLVDAFCKYVVNMLPYWGKESIPSNYVKKLTEHLNGTNKNITIANSFASVPLALQLLKDPYKLTIVGTLKSKINNKEQYLQRKQSQTAMFSCNDNMRMVSYDPKPSKRQFIFSTMQKEVFKSEDPGSQVC